MASQVSRMLASIKPHPQTFYQTKDRMVRNVRRKNRTRDMKTIRNREWQAINRVKGAERTKRRPQLMWRPKRNFTPPGINEPYVKPKEADQ